MTMMITLMNEEKETLDCIFEFDQLFFIFIYAVV